MWGSGRVAWTLDLGRGGRRAIIQGPDFLSKVQNPNPSPRSLIQAPDCSSKAQNSFPRRHVRGLRRWGLTPPFDLPRRDLFSHRFFFPFLTQLWSPKASLFDPLWRPKSTQDRPKTRLETTFFRKRRFSRGPTFSNRKCPKSTPRWRQDRPKIAPRRSYGRSKPRSFSKSFF